MVVGSVVSLGDDMGFDGGEYSGGGVRLALGRMRTMMTGSEMNVRSRERRETKMNQRKRPQE